MFTRERAGGGGGAELNVFIVPFVLCRKFLVVPVVVVAAAVVDLWGFFQIR